MALKDRLSAIEKLIRFCRDNEIRDDLLVAKEFLEIAKFFEESADEIISNNYDELEPLIGLTKRTIMKNAED